MGTSRNKIAAIAALSTIWPGLALPQQTGTAGATAVPQTGTATTPPASTPAAAATAPAAQAGGLQFDIDVSSRLTYDDNFALQPQSAGGSTIWDNTVALTLSSVTGVQDFNLNASGVFRFADIPGRSISGFEDPTIRLGYTLDGVDSRLTVNGLYRKVDREFLDPFQVEQEQQQSNVFIDNGGTVEFKQLGVIYETGLNAPVGFTLSLDHDERNYSNVSNPRLFDDKTDSADAVATFRFSPVTQLRLQAGISEYQSEDSVMTERRTTDYAVGILQDIDPTLVLDAQVGWTEVKTDATTGSTTESGATGAATLTKTMPNGTAFAAIDSAVNQNGTQTSLSFGRDLQLPSGALSATLGATRTPAGRSYLIGALVYTHQLRTSDVTVTIQRDVSTNSLSEDVLDTRVEVGYGYAINNNSRLDLRLDWGRSESAGIGNSPTVSRTSLEATYTRALTQDWDITGGVQIRRRDDSRVAGDAQSNSVFVTLDRSFSFRP